ncbi:MAG: MMPL family transporter [bacterium]|nr:MMPL family transporter [bacterium]
MFAKLGAILWRHPWRWVIAWAAAAALLGYSGPSAEQIAAVEPPSLLPADQPCNVALEVQRRAFPEVASRTRTVLIFERAGGLAATDQTYLAELARQLSAMAKERAWRILSPATHSYLRSRLLSTDGQAAMIVVHSDANYVTHRSRGDVDDVENLARSNIPAGLDFEITGEGGMGRDLAVASAAAYRRTTWVTVLALLLILAVVYRAPLAALVPLLAIAVGVYVAIAALNLLALAGWGISDTEKTFTVVLLFGSGIDFSLFWMWRLHEESARAARDATSGRTAGSGASAFVNALRATGPAILTSAATTVFGFLMLMSADLLPSHNAGRALAIALIVAVVAAVTLVPAISRLMGRRLFWPRSARGAEGAHRPGIWHAAARVVTRRPGFVLIIVLLGLAWPVWAGLRVQYHYDALGVVPAGSSAARGQAMARRHFGVGELFSWSCLIESSAIGDADPQTNIDRAEHLADALMATDGVLDVWSVADPLGKRAGRGWTGAVAAAVGQAQADRFYVRADQNCLRLEIMLDAPPLSDRAMLTCRQALDRIRAEAARAVQPDSASDAGPTGDVKLYATGLTPYILNIKRVADADQRRVMLLVVAVIGLIVLIWVRDPGLTVCMVGATLAVYAAALGITDAFFRYVLDTGGIDWKVKLFLFVVLVAVGQDYNIFMVSRIRQERKSHDPPEAVGRAVVRTGSVISSCGLIMAATLGSLAATGLPLLQQLGFAFACGVLLDTFVVRPLLVPACYLLLRRLPGRMGNA